MTTFRSFVVALQSDLAQARYQADLESAALARAYSQHEQLKQLDFSVPRMKIKEVEAAVTGFIHVYDQQRLTPTNPHLPSPSNVTLIQWSAQFYEQQFQARLTHPKSEQKKVYKPKQSISKSESDGKAPEKPRTSQPKKELKSYKSAIETANKQSNCYAISHLPESTYCLQKRAAKISSYYTNCLRQYFEDWSSRSTEKWSEWQQQLAHYLLTQSSDCAKSYSCGNTSQMSSASSYSPKEGCGQELVVKGFSNEQLVELTTSYYYKALADCLKNNKELEEAIQKVAQKAQVYAARYLSENKYALQERIDRLANYYSKNLSNHVALSSQAIRDAVEAAHPKLEHFLLDQTEQETKYASSLPATYTIKDTPAILDVAFSKQKVNENFQPITFKFTLVEDDLLWDVDKAS